MAHSIPLGERSNEKYQLHYAPYFKVFLDVSVHTYIYDV
jgi:hypothetical protein